MALSHSADIRAVLSASTSETSRADANYTLNFPRSLAVALAEGSGSGQCNKIYSVSGTLSTSATLDLDLAGSLEDAAGNAVVMTSIKALVIVNKCTTTGVNLQVGAGTNPVASIWGAAGDIMKIGPSAGTSPGFLVWVSPQDGFAVAAGSADVLRLTNSSGSVTLDYDIYVIGVG